MWMQKNDLFRPGKKWIQNNLARGDEPINAQEVQTTEQSLWQVTDASVTGLHSRIIIHGSSAYQYGEGGWSSSQRRKRRRTLLGPVSETEADKLSSLASMAAISSSNRAESEDRISSRLP